MIDFAYKNIIYTSFLSIFIYIILVNFISFNLIKSFPKIKNYKNSDQRLLKYRGMGIFYIFSLLPFFYLFFSDLSFSTIGLITTFTILGFIDDKYDLSSHFKLLIIILISLLYNANEVSTEGKILNIYQVLDFLNQSFFLIFLILLFNQIDGINGLAGLTYICALLVILIFFGINVLIFFPFLIIVSTYLFFNLRGNIGIQGDSGSYFLATTFFILVTNYTQNLNIYHSLIFLCPVLFDVVCTTIVRLILFKNILKPHLNNLYQRVASYNNNHLKSTFSFICFQIIFSLFMLLCLKYKYFDLINYICIFTFILFLWIAYLIHNDKILFKIKVKD